MYGYARVSTQEQHEDRQVNHLLEQGINQKYIYVDKQSGKDFNRPMYKKLVRRLSENDILYIKSIDRLGRNYEEILNQWQVITKDKKADIVVLDMPILDTRNGKDLIGTVLSDVILTLLSYVAENERHAIRQRQAEGIVAAKAKGVQFGRKRIKMPYNFDTIYIAYNKGYISIDEALKKCNISRATFYRRCREYKEQQKK